MEQMSMTPGIQCIKPVKKNIYVILMLNFTWNSEKQRIPGWTDRILFKGAQLNQLQYSRAELRTSDHRPGTIIKAKQTNTTTN